MHSYPIRGYKKSSDTQTEASNNALSVKTDHDIQPKSPQVEMTDTPEHVETEDSSVNVEMSPPSKGMLVPCSYELKKYKRPQRFKCKLCGDSSSSMKELNAHHHSTHDVQFCDDCGKDSPQKVPWKSMFMYIRI